MTATAFRFLLRPDLVIVPPDVGQAKAKADCPAAFLRRAREMDSRRAVAAVSFAVRFLPATGLFAVVLFSLCRFPICFATADFVPAADSFGLARSDFAVAGSAGFVAVVAAGFAVAVVAGSADFAAVAAVAAVAGSADFAVAVLAFGVVAFSS